MSQILLLQLLTSQKEQKRSNNERQRQIAADSPGNHAQPLHDLSEC